MFIKDDQATPVTTQEILTAIDQLTEQEELILERTARWLVRFIKKRAFGFEEEDLLHEAITLTLVGQRRWCKNKVTLCKHLHGVMKSIADHWWKSKSRQSLTLESDLYVETENSDSINPMQNFKDDEATDAEAKIIEEEHFAKIKQLTQSREFALLIIEGIREGMTGKEIRELGLTKTQYETEMKWIRRNLKLVFEK